MEKYQASRSQEEGQKFSKPLQNPTSSSSTAVSL